MVSLLDLAPSTRLVAVGGESVSVLGVSAEGIASLLTQFPQLKEAFTGGLKLDVATITNVAPNAIAAIIAAGCGFPGDGKAVAAAAKLPVGNQIEMLSAVIEMTMPQGIGPFMDALNQIIARLDTESHGKAPASK